MNKITLWAISSRVLTVLLSCLASQFAGGAYDTSSDFALNLLHNEPQTRLDALINGLFGSLVRWDAVYFLDIAEHGYRNEQSTAFLPGLPFLVNLVADGMSKEPGKAWRTWVNWVEQESDAF
jgi:phosphatidylinositol glycan class V